METFQVKNVEEAIDLAYKLKEEGRYNWFRGQTREAWLPISSFSRVHISNDIEKLEKTYRRFEMFVKWMNDIPQLNYLLEKKFVHDFFAVAQHYGIPTHYIDFTTDPGIAGYFAADTEHPPIGEESCIFCLNTDDLLDYFSSDMLDMLSEINDTPLRLEIIEIDVQNLWRLQAQQGVFLFADFDWTGHYPMDKIIFPYSGYPSYPTKERIYPKDKSPLEELLDQYFQIEKAAFFNDEFRRKLEELKGQGHNTGILEWEIWEDGYYKEAFVDSFDRTPVDSWKFQSPNPWDVYLNEDYHQSIGPTFELNLNTSSSEQEFKKSLTFGVRQLLRSNPTLRTKTVNWSFSTLPESLTSDELNKVFQKIWNGMRRLPFTDAEIADVFGTVALLLLKGFNKVKFPEQERELLWQQFNFIYPMKVEFSNISDNSYSRGWVSKDNLMNALRKDMSELLVPEHKKLADDLNELFKVIYNPRLMFEFEEFKRIFVQQVIPTQVASGRDLIIFNPARLKTFGKP